MSKQPVLAKDREELPPPCTAACPVGTDARRYFGLISQGRYEDALDVIKANNVIASVCAYICAHIKQADGEGWPFDLGLRDVILN
ncbi:MAG: hypothetical protein P8X65_06505 [Syntrophobacterales bacterium]